MNAFLVLATLSLSCACASLNPIDFIKPKAESGISVETQIGKEANKQIILGDQIKAERDVITTNSQLNQPEDVTINNNHEQPPLYLLALFGLGVLFPSPFKMWSYGRNQWRKIRGKSNGYNK